MELLRAHHRRCGLFVDASPSSARFFQHVMQVGYRIQSISSGLVIDTCWPHTVMSCFLPSQWRP
ncbi:hypothetical protein GU90_14870 [Saccharopolyspora rectivirgula]|uniref:Uncharacterized protein n=1 Tax=Saccharopolyspora rectivirgula TaxID=28042 RepID=A0A073B7I1_9PSEU|nr:hypothetical protein GU90_14870 [Saccharopolyspora rectivirgula]